MHIAGTARLGSGGVAALLLIGGLAALLAGGVLYAFALPEAARWTWHAATAIVLVHTLVGAARGILRREFGIDIVAVLAMGGALALDEALAGAVIAVMVTGGSALERFAITRARRDLTALLARAPRIAHRKRGVEIVDMPVADVTVGDVLLVKSGEVVPADGVLLSASGVLDEAALTGETRVSTVERGSPLRSGSTNAAAPFEVRVTAPPADSTYAGIVRLVGAAETSKAPFVRLADRWALAFIGLTLVIAAAAWIVSGSPTRALAVLVVATPCPLILAAPAAIIAGVSRAAKHGIIIKGGGPLETLARVRLLLLDKTGTVTAARPRVVSVESFGAMSSDHIVSLAASIEQMSLHPYAPAVVAEARRRRLELAFPSDLVEQMGAGIGGSVDGVRVCVGQLAFVAPTAERTTAVHSVEIRKHVEGSSSVYVAVDGVLAGALLLQDPIRPEAPRALRLLRKAGIEKIHLVTGDHPDVAELVGDALGIDRVFAERAPQDKVDVVRRIRSEGTTAMVGDGINDAPALALADVGIAMGARGATAASEAADIVLTSDRLDALVLAVRIAKRTRRIAVQSVAAGMGLSLVAMIAAAAGYIPPVMGAVLQEVIDVLVIVAALRALGAGGLAPPRRPAMQALAQQLASAHDALRPRVDELAALAARVDTLPPDEALARIEAARAMLVDELLPHEASEQETAYPVLSELLADEDPTSALVQTHQEIRRLTRLFDRLVKQLPRTGPGSDELRDLRRLLFGLHAILTLHFAQEEELYSML